MLPFLEQFFSVQSNHLNSTKQKHSSAGANNLLDSFERCEYTFEVQSDKAQKQRMENYPQCFLSALECAAHLFVKEGINIQDIVKISLIF